MSIKKKLFGIAGLAARMSPEYRAIKRGLKILAGGVALDPSDQKEFEAIIDSLEESAKSLAESAAKKQTVDNTDTAKAIADAVTLAVAEFEKDRAEADQANDEKVSQLEQELAAEKETTAAALAEIRSTLANLSAPVDLVAFEKALIEKLTPPTPSEPAE